MGIEESRVENEATPAEHPHIETLCIAIGVIILFPVIVFLVEALKRQSKSEGSGFSDDQVIKERTPTYKLPKFSDAIRTKGKKYSLSRSVIWFQGYSELLLSQWIRDIIKDRAEYELVLCTDNLRDDARFSNSLQSEFNDILTSKKVKDREDMNALACYLKNGNKKRIVVLANMMDQCTSNHVATKEMIVNLQFHESSTCMVIVNTDKQVHVPNWLKNEVKFVGILADATRGLLRNAYRQWMDPTITAYEFSNCLQSVPDGHAYLLDHRAKIQSPMMQRFSFYDARTE
jgi:hypothetical protein